MTDSKYKSHLSNKLTLLDLIKAGFFSKEKLEELKEIVALEVLKEFENSSGGDQS